MSLKPNGELTPVGGGDPIPLLRETMTVGRRESCDVRLNFPNVSGIHCQLNFRDGYWFIRDLNSTNGIKVNGTRVQEKILHPQDEISIGKRTYLIQYDMPVGGQRAMEDMEEDILSQSLLEKAGLERPRRQQKAVRSFDAGDFLLSEDED